MKMQKNIKLNAETVKDFVAAACQCDFDVDIFYNSYIVDAKSILGVYGLDLKRVLTVRYDGYDPKFEAFLNSLAVAC